MSTRARAVAAGVGVLAAVLAWSELVHWRSSRRGVLTVDSAGAREAVIVLGFRNRGERANYVNRYRIRAGLRSQSREAAESLLVLCGGAAPGSIPEAELMASYARELGHGGPVRLERESRSTWENVVNATPFIENADVIKIVSNSLHAEKARGYLTTLRPDLAARLARADEHRFGEVLILKTAAAVGGITNLRRGPYRVRWSR